MCVLVCITEHCGWDYGCNLFDHATFGMCLVTWQHPTWVEDACHVQLVNPMGQILCYMNFYHVFMSTGQIFFFCFERDWSDLINDYLNIVEIINIVHLLTCQSLKNSKAHLHMFFLPISCSVYFALFDFNYSNKQVVLLPLSIPLPNCASHLLLQSMGSLQITPDHL